ncbi:hypothetical protein [Microbispora sp. NPDC049633]|uniref:hypothetical protein n=1 Tax=Microbispora sp. NPDC049633 TaxID=3154355 RepID=UPI003439CDCA
MLPRGQVTPARPSPALDRLVICVGGALLALLRAWADGDVSATPAELDATFRATVLPGVRSVLVQG